MLAGITRLEQRGEEMREGGGGEGGIPLRRSEAFPGLQQQRDHFGGHHLGGERCVHLDTFLTINRH